MANAMLTDTNNDGIPDTNLDHQGNREPTYNVDDNSGELKNKTNQDTDGDGVCDINCDTNGDGWPDTNLDKDGNGIPELNLDKNKDGIPDANIDTDGDGVCNLNCDDDNDGVCDRFCAEIITPGNDDDKNQGNGDVSQNGDGGAGIETPSLVVMFESQSSVVTENLYPDDQPGDVNKTVPDLIFTIENPTDVEMTYSLNWIDVTNTFITDNFIYRVSSDNGGLNQEWAPTPKNDALIKSGLTIAPHTKQTYTISLTLHGINAEQNDDQGRKFSGRIKVELTN